MDTKFFEKYYQDLCLIYKTDKLTAKKLLHGTNVKDLNLSETDTTVLTGIVEKYKELSDNQILNHTTFKLSDLDLEMIRNIPPGGNWQNIPMTTRVKSKRLMRLTETGGRTTLYGRLKYDEPSYTITTYFNRPGNGCNIHPIHDRVLSVREAARLQSFPDEYYFWGNKTQLLKQVGNAVPPVLAQQIAESIIEKIDCGTSIDLFCGAGGMTLGFKRAGIKSIIANDIEKSACITLRINNPEIPVLCGDITQESVKDQIISIGLEQKADIICGGPPCQGFSLAGLRADKDPRNKLFKDFVEIVKGVMPKVIVFENVEGILSYNSGKTYKEILSLFDELGYLTGAKKLLCNEYGVPQRRKRVIIICSRKDLEIDPMDLFPVPTSPEKEQQPTVRDAIYDLENVPCGENAKYQRYMP